MRKEEVILGRSSQRGENSACSIHPWSPLEVSLELYYLWTLTPLNTTYTTPLFHYTCILQDNYCVSQKPWTDVLFFLKPRYGLMPIKYSQNTFQEASHVCLASEDALYPCRLVCVCGCIPTDFRENQAFTASPSNAQSAEEA
jgi:hypothetical protein